MTIGNWVMKAMYIIVAALLVLVAVLTVMPGTRPLARDIAAPLLTGALALATLLLAMFAERQASAAEKAVTRAERAEKANRHRFWVEHGPQPAIKLTQERDTLGVLWIGVFFYNSGKSDAVVRKLWIENHDMSDKVKGKIARAGQTSWGSNEYIKIFDNYNDSVLNSIVEKAESNGFFDMKLECDCSLFPNETIVTEQRNFREPDSGNWRNGEPQTRLIETTG